MVSKEGKKKKGRTIPAKQVCTASDKYCGTFLPYQDRPKHKVIRPYDEYDDGTAAYLSESEEELSST